MADTGYFTDIKAVKLGNSNLPLTQPSTILAQEGITTTYLTNSAVADEVISGLFATSSPIGFDIETANPP
jgi:hypothetical protein